MGERGRGSTRRSRRTRGFPWLGSRRPERGSLRRTGGGGGGVCLCRRWSGSKWAAAWGWEASRGCKESDCAANLRGERPEVVVRRGGRGGGTRSLLRRAAGAGAERNGRRRKKERLWGFGVASNASQKRGGERERRYRGGPARRAACRASKPNGRRGAEGRGRMGARGPRWS